MKFLVIDASAPYRKMLKALIETPEKTVYVAASCGEARWMWKQHCPHAVLIDPALPDGDGMEVCLEAQRTHPALVLAMSTCTGAGDEITCLQRGADVYLRKPFLPEQLSAYIEALSRRHRRTREIPEPSAFVSALEYGQLKVEIGSRTVWCEGKEITLTPIEYRLLILLVVNQRQVVTHDVILQRVWGGDYDDLTLIKAHIRHLREKIGPYIENVRSVGYRLAPLKEATKATAS